MRTPAAALSQFLADRGWTQLELDGIIQRPAGTTNRIINGRLGISVRTARELAAAFGTTPQYWTEKENARRLAELENHPTRER